MLYGNIFTIFTSVHNNTNELVVIALQYNFSDRPPCPFKSITCEPSCYDYTTVRLGRAGSFHTQHPNNFGFLPAAVAARETRLATGTSDHE
jgi:hypothetical protein